MKYNFVKIIRIPKNCKWIMVLSKDSGINQEDVVSMKKSDFNDNPPTFFIFVNGDVRKAIKLLKFKSK